MGGWKLWFALLLPLTFSVNRKETGREIVKTIGKETDVTPICTNDTQNIITLIVCKIPTERNEGQECRLLYEYKRGFESECDSRFTLIMKNQTFSLQLTNLTPEVSGNYSCECSGTGGTDILHLNLTVEGDEETEDPGSLTELHLPVVVISVIIFIFITGAILGFIHRKQRRRLEFQTSRPNMEPQNTDQYNTFIERENELYSLAPYVFTRED